MMLMDSCGFVRGHGSSLDTITWSSGLVPKSQYRFHFEFRSFSSCVVDLLNDVRGTEQEVSTFGLAGKLDWWEEEMGRSFLHSILERLLVSSVGDVVCCSACDR